MLGTILIVDDDRSILRLLNAYFMRRGWTVHTSETAVALEALVAAHSPDVVLCDLCVPERDAVEFLLDRAACVENDFVRQTPVVIMSAHAIVDCAIDADMGVAAVVHKPFDLDELNDLINSVARDRQRTISP